MYLVILKEDLHGDKTGFISLSKSDLWDQIVAALNNWDTPFVPHEIESLLNLGHYTFNEHSKTCVEITITEIQPGEAFDF